MSDNKIAILIIFSYADSIEDGNRWKLPGVGVDLYHSYNYVKNRGFNKILVITDIIIDPKVESIRRTIIRGIVDVNIVSIISKIKTDDNYWYYTHKNELIEKIKKYIYNEEKIFIYYSGHASNNILILPKLIRYF